MKLALATLAALSLAASASAISVDLVVTDAAGSGIASFNGNSVTVTEISGTGSFTVDVQLDIGDAGASVAGMSLEFDTDLSNELNVVSYQELNWSLVNMMGTVSRTFTQLSATLASSQESCSGNVATAGCTEPPPPPGIAKPPQEGQLYTFEAATTGTGPDNTTLTFARVVFEVNWSNITSDGDDIFSGFFNAQDGMFDNGSPSASAYCGSPGSNPETCEGDVTFSNIAVNKVPEPGVVPLALLATGGLLLVAPRRRR
ncbi:hypothetical protein MK489_07540 [Myxococcota bacterium]|nr:hypothetical protein [Myxococcota bacterium]